MGIHRRRSGRRRLTLVAAALLATAGAARAACDADRVDLRGDWGAARFSVELALTAEEQARGLMFRERLARNAGMLFVYEREQPVSFWMRNTLIPLDMIFLDDAGVVVKVHAEAVPGDETPIPSGAPARAVLEIPGGMAATLGIAEGDALRSPILPQDGAAWPCP